MIYLLALICLLSGCSHPSESNEKPKLSSITFIDSNGFTETVTSHDRLDQYKNVNFLQPQSYQKVMRVYSRDKEGNIHSELTSYHPTGHIKQCLEAKNNQASGLYQAWYPSQIKSVEAHVLSGSADLSDSAEKSWLFDGTSFAWNEDGSLAARIEYKNGSLEGDSLYYHPNGSLWKRAPFVNNQLNGCLEIFLDNGEKLQTISYENGLKNGPSNRYWQERKIASQEVYKKGLLEEAVYYDMEGVIVAEIKQGNGYRAVFGVASLAELHEYRNGSQEGVVKVFSPAKNLLSEYHVKNLLKHGSETEYYENTSKSFSVKPKISLNWYLGIIQGTVKTWYENGTLESQREISHNKKNGLATAWYHDGSLMMIEEYEQDALTRGEYYKKGDKTPMSQVWLGNGIASLYDSEGNFIRKVNYLNGLPQE